jgi:hypothetical protein
MILAPLVGAALVVTVATGPITTTDPTALRPTARERSAAMQPLVQRTTDCIASHVAADPRYAKDAVNGNIGDLIVDSVPPCMDAVRAMIDAYDRYYGDGTGEAFFMGPYLDVLPTAVSRLATGLAPRSAAEHSDGADGSR